MIRCYLSSPYSIGDREHNVYRQKEAAVKLIDLGFKVEWPLSSHYLDLHFPRSYDYWLEYDLKLLEACDCLLRLDGESKGADIEVQKAKELGIKVFYDIESLVAWRD